LNFDQIYLTESNEVYPPNSLRPFEAISQLLGDSSRLEQMQNFISNVSIWAYDQFMLNNFKDPEVIKSSNSNDPQFQLFQRTLNGTQINMMDFGCGKGRLLNILNSDKKLLTKFSRIDAFEPNPDFHNNLKLITCVSNVYDKLNDIVEKYDIILLSNVLHEIKLNEIVPTLNKIKSSLSDDGFLVILEDLVLKKGEKPNDNGYLVFGAHELSILLKTGDKYFEIKHENEKYKERIMCFVAPLSSLKQSNKNSLEDALISLKNRSKNQLKELRTNGSYSEGRTYGFYAQQYINAEFALEENN
jgi:2-polyprenyl-3-methyl-5-hydroxy-6-metoxy-1,4-benzoquinol methylase